MNKINIPICFYPTRIVVIDDNEDFLELLSLKLDASYGDYKFYSNPKQALSYLNEEYKPDPYINHITSEIEGEGFQHRALDINLYELPKEIYNKDRFNQISCLVVDYDMPAINGLEFCRSIKDHFIHKILLTGAADDKIAIEAFNEGVIQHFITKSDTNMFKKVNLAILQAQQSYFRMVGNSNILFSNIAYTTILKEPKFIELFNSLLTEHNIIEYYLFEDSGCYLMVSTKGEIYGLFIYPEREIDDMAEEAVGILGENSKVAKALKARSEIFCYYRAKTIYSNENGFPDISERETYLRPAKEFIGKYDKYYYAFTSDIMEIDKDKLVLFSNFQK